MPPGVLMHLCMPDPLAHTFSRGSGLQKRSGQPGCHAANMIASLARSAMARGACSGAPCWSTSQRRCWPSSRRRCSMLPALRQRRRRRARSPTPRRGRRPARSRAVSLNCQPWLSAGLDNCCLRCISSSSCMCARGMHSVAGKAGGDVCLEPVLAATLRSSTHGPEALCRRDAGGDGRGRLAAAVAVRGAGLWRRRPHRRRAAEHRPAPPGCAALVCPAHATLRQCWDSACGDTRPYVLGKAGQPADKSLQTVFDALLVAICMMLA